MHRMIFHLDTDASCASVEQRDQPALKGKPVMFGSPPNQRGGDVNHRSAFVFRPEFMWGREFPLRFHRSEAINPSRHSERLALFKSYPAAFYRSALRQGMSECPVMIMHSRARSERRPPARRRC